MADSTDDRKLSGDSAKDLEGMVSQLVTIPEPLRSPSDKDLVLFAGAAGMLCVLGIVSYWVVDFRAVVTAQVGALIGAATMYMRGK